MSLLQQLDAPQMGGVGYCSKGRSAQARKRQIHLSACLMNFLSVKYHPIPKEDTVKPMTTAKSAGVLGPFKWHTQCSTGISN